MVGVVLAIAAWFVISVLATAVLAAAGAYALARGRRLERKMATELGGRWEQDGSSLLDAELNISLEQLLDERDTLMQEFRQVQDQIRQVRTDDAIRGRIATMGDTSNVVPLRERESADRAAIPHQNR
jgi:hypothetical protein